MRGESANRGTLRGDFSVRWARWLCLICIVFLVGCSYGRAIKRGDELFQSGRYEEALSAYEEALREKPASEQAVAGIRAARQQMVRLRIDAAQSALAEGDLLSALAQWNAASSVPGKYADLQKLGTRLVQQAVEQTEIGIENEEYSYVLDVYERFYHSGLGEQHDFGGRHAEVSEGWAAKLYRRGQQASEEGQGARAVLLFGKAALLDNRVEYRAERDRVWQRVREELLYRVRVHFISDSGVQVVWTGPELLAPNALFMRVSQDFAGAKSDADLYVQSLETTIQHGEWRRVVSVEYQSGTRTVPNPEYAYLERELYQADRRLMSAEREATDEQQKVARFQVELERARERERDGTSTYRSRQALADLEGAQIRLNRAYEDVQDRRRNVQRLRDRMYRTYQFLEEPVYSLYDYPITTYWVEGAVEVDVQIEHADGREAIRFVRELTVKQSDEAYDSHPTIGVSRKLVDLPADQEIEEQLLQKVAEEIMVAARESFDNHRAMVLARAKAESGRSARVDDLVRSMLLSGREARQDVEDEIYELEGIFDARLVLTALEH